jgi:hypothetical protein
MFLKEKDNMKMKHLLSIAAIATSLLVSSCSNSIRSDIPTYTSTGESDTSVTIYLELGKGGLFNDAPGGENKALYLQNAVKWVAEPGSELPGKDVVTNTNGVAFTGWEYVPGHGHGELMTHVPNYEGLVLYATFGDAPNAPIGDYDWFIVGSGSFVTGAEWNASGGIGMEENPEHPYSAAEYMAIGVAFEAGDTWKINNPTTGEWIQTGWESQEGSSVYAGDMKSVEDGYGGSNIQVVTTGVYDIYLKLYDSGDPTVWIQSHVEVSE